MYFIREIDGHEPTPKIEIKEGAWEYFFQISATIHSDKSAEFRGNLADHGTRVAIADIVAAAVASLYRAGKLSNREISGMLDLCSDSLSNHQFRSLPLEEMRNHLFKVQDAFVVVLGCQNLNVLNRRACAAVKFCIDIGKSMTLVLSGLRPPHGKIRTRHEYLKMREYVDAEFRRRGAEILKVPSIIHIVDEDKSSDTRQNLRNVLSHASLQGKNTSALVVVSSTFHLMQIAKILNGYIEKNDFGIKDRFSFVGLVGADKTEDAAAFTTHDWQYVKQLAFQLFLDHIE